MRIIRKNCFETNSSSQHAITVPSNVDWKTRHDYLINDLKSFKKGNEYIIELEASEDKMVGESFTIRRYIPHYSFVDKAIYAFATIYQHYDAMLASGIPYDSSVYIDNWNNQPKKAFDMKIEEAHEKFLREKEEYVNLHAESNKKVFKAFSDKIKYLEEHLSTSLGRYLNSRDRFVDEGWDDYEKTCPIVKVHFKYRVDNDMNVFYVNTEDDAWFSTGCYNNEEFYSSICYSEYNLTNWITNPYSAILAGSDEQSTFDNLQQEYEAERLIKESWKNTCDETTWPDWSDEEIDHEVEEHCYTWGTTKAAEKMLKLEKQNFRKFLKEHRGEPRLPNGKIIWPIGG